MYNMIQNECVIVKKISVSIVIFIKGGGGVLTIYTSMYINN